MVNLFQTIKILKYFESTFKLQLFKSLKRFLILSFDKLSQPKDEYYRCCVKIKDLLNNHIVEGMGEGHTHGFAKLRALAEAYEQICLYSYQTQSQIKFDLSFPYGLGVGFRKKSALLRAYGEYFERLTYYTSHYTNLGEFNTEIPQRIQTPIGSVFISAQKTLNGKIGTGYGISSDQAKDSAKR
ncbi:MAG: hypothetical protein HY072_02480, partial [Deltaproteobacteria bacterium]|nr:hypothetical protein [Deltaproteobacteria bacterium]